MNKIILAYSRDNAALAQAVAQPLSRLGIPFEHVTDQPDDQAGHFAAYLQQSDDPVLLFVTDNFLKSRDCMAAALGLVQQLARQQRLVAVVADGVDAHGQAVETQIDRMVNAIQYTNYWQSIYLDLSGQQAQVPAGERPAFDAELAIVRDISNEIFELITALRESRYLSWQQLAANDFALFFQKFGLNEWHEQYRRLNSPPGPASALPLAPEEEKPVQAPVVTGPLAPAPAESEPLAWPDDALIPSEEPAESPSFERMDSLMAEMPEEESTPEGLVNPEEPAAVETTPPNAEDDVSQTIRDAWFWLDNGHIERGLQVFQLALEEHPHHPTLRAQYETAFARFGPKNDVPNAPDAEETKAVAEEPVSSEARSYDLIGEESVAKGDYLFAKFCWDRVAELSPNYPNIFRKLGLLTSEHLRDYRETAIYYLEKALEHDPDDELVRERLAALLQAPALTPAEPVTLEEEDRDVPFEPLVPEPDATGALAPASEAEAALELDRVPVEPGLASLGEQTTEAPTTPSAPQDRLTVLITGATSGIGLATARLFARHGHRLILTGRRGERLDDLKEELNTDFQSDVLTLKFDVRNFAAVGANLENLPEEWRNVDVLLNNAGLAKGLAPIHEGDLEDWDTMIDTNLKGLLYVTRCIAPHMVRRHRGHIINLGSSAGKEVYAQGNVYCATKFAVDALTRAMRLDLHMHNIRVSQVSPGHVEETEFALNRFHGDAAKAQIYQDFQPLKAADVAEVIYFIATRPPHVNIQDIWLYGSQQASSTVIDRSGR